MAIRNANEGSWKCVRKWPIVRQDRREGKEWSEEMPRSVELDPELEAVVDTLIADGRYGSVSDVMRAGIELVSRRESRLAEIDESVMQGLADFEAGRIYDVTDVFDELEAKYDAMSVQAKQ